MDLSRRPIIQTASTKKFLSSSASMSEKLAHVIVKLCLSQRLSKMIFAELSYEAGTALMRKKKVNLPSLYVIRYISAFSLD
jgi:hypothetical protein